MNKKKILSLIIFIILLIIAYIGYGFYTKIKNPNTTKKGFIYIKSKASFDDLLLQINPFLKDEKSFKWVANKKKFTKPKAGKYLIKKSMSNNDLVNMLRSGRQIPVKVAFNNQNSLEKLASRISSQIEADSIQLLKSFKGKQFLKENDFTEDQVLGMFIPNSYQFKWNTSANQFRDKMIKEYNKFWNKDRLLKAKKLNLTPIEVTTLASIVHKETVKKSERPIVAGLYLNRIRDKWPLESDPTVIYAMNKKYGKDLGIRRLLFKNIEETKNSPYNTYKKLGLPPSLIAMPDISAIDAVLNAKNHNYYFMCASVTKIGYHEFAKTLAQHNRNRTKYIQKKNKQGVRQ